MTLEIQKVAGFHHREEELASPCGSTTLGPGKVLSWTLVLQTIISYWPLNISEMLVI